MQVINTITYHVRGMLRVACLNIYHPEVYFVQAVVKLPKRVAGELVSTITVGR